MFGEKLWNASERFSVEQNQVFHYAKGIKRSTLLFAQSASLLNYWKDV